MATKQERQKKAAADVQRLLGAIASKAEIRETGHRISARRLRNFHYWLGAPSVVLNAVVGTSIFVAIQEAATNLALRIIMAAVTFLATGGSALTVFFGFLARSATHRALAAGYGEIRDEAAALQLSVATNTSARWLEIILSLGKRFGDLGMRGEEGADLVADQDFASQVTAQAYAIQNFVENERDTPVDEDLAKFQELYRRR